MKKNINKYQKNEEEKKFGENKNMDLKKVMDYSVKNVKKFGNFMKKEGIKGYGLMKKYGGIIAKKSKPVFQSAKNYVKEHIQNFNKKDDNSTKEEDKREVIQVDKTKLIGLFSQMEKLQEELDKLS